MTQDFVPAAPISWPAGKKSAASFTFDIDAESAVLFASPGSEFRAGVMSHQSYGPLVGVPRLLSILDRVGIKSTFFVPGYTALRYPKVVKDIVAAGHEIAHHGFMHETLEGVDVATETKYLIRGLEALEQVAGVRPVGYRAPMWEPSYDTARILQEHGFLYDSTMMDADYPYEYFVADGASIVEIPIQWALDDWEQYCFIPDVSGVGLIESPTKVIEMWNLEFQATHEIGGCFVLTNHPFLSGRPSRAKALEGFIRDVVSDSSVWVTTLEELALHVRSLKLEPRHLVQPIVDKEYRSG
jgi:peptidoglycan/xylan/chitin deacetylase (PgdA/CDA1 family)